MIPHSNTRSAVDIFSRCIFNVPNHRPFHLIQRKCAFVATTELSVGKKTQHKSVFAGQHFDIPVLTVDQANKAIPSIFHAELNNENRSYIIANHCTKREYTFTSANQITLYPSSVSGETVELTSFFKIVHLAFDYSIPLGNLNVTTDYSSILTTVTLTN